MSLIPINKPMLSEEEKSEVVRVLESGQLTSQAFEGGPMVNRLEEEAARYLNVKHVVAVNSGSTALYVSLWALGVGRGDEVLTSSFSFVAAANVSLHLGAKPVFVDIDFDDYCMNPKDLTKKVTARSKVVIPTHLYGYPAKMEQITEVASKRGLRIVEDAAQSLGATFAGKQTGTLGDLGCFSLWGSKIITTGEGGLIATNSDELAGKIRIIRNQGLSRDGQVALIGWNMRMPEIEAAIAHVQLRKLPSFLASRRKNAEALLHMLAGVKDIRLPHEDETRKANWYLYTVAVENGRDGILSRVRAKGVDARVYYDPPVHLLPPYVSLGYKKQNLKNTRWASKHVFSLPVHPGLSSGELATVAESVKHAVGQ